MPDTLQLVLALAGVLLGGGTAGTLLTLWFTRRKTHAEAGKFDAEADAKRAEAHKIDSDANRTEAETMRLMYAEIRTAIGQWADCTKERAEALARLAESTAENGQLKAAVELLRQENVVKDKTITELHGRLNA